MKRWLRQLMNKYVKFVLEDLEILGKLGKLEAPENLEQPNPHPLLLAVQRLYNRLSHSFQCVAVDVLQVIV